MDESAGALGRRSTPRVFRLGGQDSDTHTYTHARPYCKMAQDNRLAVLPQETLWSIWEHCSFFDLVRISRVSTATAASVFAFVAERRLAADEGIQIGSSTQVVRLLTWWLRMARHTVRVDDDDSGGTGSDHVVVVECHDAAQRDAIHAWARRFGCASERAVYARFRPRRIYTRACGLVSSLSSLAWTEHDSGHTTATCKRCRSFVVTSYAVDLDILPANDGDPAWTLTHNAVVVTADPARCRSRSVHRSRATTNPTVVPSGPKRIVRPPTTPKPMTRSRPMSPMPLAVGRSGSHWRCPSARHAPKDCFQPTLSRVCATHLTPAEKKTDPEWT
ncbi:hypothetical protein pqer_cds_763 [Pandoravirus quercus]|uniref:F-box domain containing protein n=1 Tax=Pandoravirus quercus TaxID=2107709 RepID=A0A2U7U9X1_9VIRU|nr:hypothetical protein pqer_cds_763 [Pandoravirus quercus]AVK75185.1 hypothetical protein pqer_cds_763 [Pandoravirus quercus]